MDTRIEKSFFFTGLLVTWSGRTGFLPDTVCCLNDWPSQFFQQPFQRSQLRPRQMVHLSAMQFENRLIQRCEQVAARLGDMHNDEAAILLGPLSPPETAGLKAVQSS